MKKEHLDNELYEILHFAPEIPPQVQKQINNAYIQIKNDVVSTRKRKKNRSRLYLGFAAALILAFGFWGFSNPVLAGKIPFIGRIFQLVENKIGYPGNYSEHSVPITPPEAEAENEPENASDADGDMNTGNPPANGDTTDTDINTYSQSVGDVTVTLSEACYTDMALYFSVELYSEEGFPEDFNRVKNMEDYILSYDVLNMQCSQTFDFAGAEELPTPYAIQGNYADSHTFLGVIRIDLETIRNILGVESLPQEFTYSLNLIKFWGRLDEAKEVTLDNPDTGKTETIMTAAKKYYEGPWNFTISVSLDQNDTQIREIMQTNADGIGISKVTRTPYEMKADIILPENADPVDYVVAITDADGKLLDSQGNVAEIYSIYGRNTDTVHIYVVDYFTFMDECKAENTYLLREKALFQTTIEW